MTRQIITGLDIGTASIRIAVCEFKDGSSQPEILALVRRSSRGLRRGYIINLEETVDAIREAVAEAERLAKQKIKRVYLGIGGVTLESKAADGGAVVARADLEISKSDIRRAIDDSENNLTEMSNRQVLHRLPVAFKLEGKKILGRPEGMHGTKLDVRSAFITYSKQHLKDFVAAVEDAGLIIEDIIAAPLAASIIALSPLQRASGCVLVNIGSQTTSIAVFEENIPLSLHVFPLGSMDITNDIALGFKIPLEEAERVKKHESEPEGSRKKLDEIIEARISDIFEYIEVHLKKIGRNGLLPAGIVMTGGGAGVQNIEDMAKDYLKLPARLANPTRLTAGQNQTIDPAWAVAYGLCIYNNEYELDGKESSHSHGSPIKTALKWLKEFMP